MKVYRITHKKWADSLSASGYAARWNSNGFFAIYTAENCSLACLENLVHRNGFGLDADFCVITIDIPDTLKKTELKLTDLPKNWAETSEKAHVLCRKFGDSWLQNQTSCIFVVPSAIIPNEKNIILNPNHKDFKKIKIDSVQPFRFDQRLKP
jgi:RES domain-containing protein